jgi:hypothetical protein
MSIAPVSSVPPASSEQTDNASVRSSPTQANPASEADGETAQAVSGTLSKQNSSAARNVSSTYELPQDVVEVHQDPDIKNQIIIQYLDQAKDVVLQVPSNQELAVERGIAQEFQQAAKLRASEGTAAPVGVGEKTHGD